MINAGTRSLSYRLGALLLRRHPNAVLERLKPGTKIPDIPVDGLRFYQAAQYKKDAKKPE